MATRAQVRRIALSLPGTAEATDRFAFAVLNKGKLKGFAWVWMERVAPKKPRVPNPGVLAVRVANLGQKSALLAEAWRCQAPSEHTRGKKRGVPT
jgi:hypothetical protein